MRVIFTALAALVLTVLMPSCGSSKDFEAMTEWSPGFYSVMLEVGPDETHFGVIEVLEEVDGGALVRIFGDVFEERPEDVLTASLRYAESRNLPGWGGDEVVMRDDMLTGMKAEIL